MIRPLALLRPEPGWSASAAKARELGIAVIGHPLFVPEAIAWTVPDGAFDALLAGSATVFCHGGAGLDTLRHLPVHAVGAATAAAAQAAGFTVTRVGEGGLQALLDASKGKPLRFLRLGGVERVNLTPRGGQELTEIAVYRMCEVGLTAAFAERLEEGNAVVALHSAAAARHFEREVERLRLPRAELLLLALGPRIAEAAGLGWAAVLTARRPNDAELLAKAGALCKEGPQGRETADTAANGSQNGSG